MYYTSTYHSHAMPKHVYNIHSWGDSDQCDHMTRIFFNIWLFTTMKIRNIAYQICSKLSWKYCQILNDHFQNDQSVLTFCQSSEISPNLVTLAPTKVPHNARYSVARDLPSAHSQLFDSLLFFRPR